jgi:hypothetical protein
MRDGLYKVQFQTPLGWGAGVVFAQGDKLWGGDAGLCYVGTHSQDGNQVTAKVKTFRHTQHPGIQSVFGRDQVNIELKGTAEGDSVQCSGTAPEAPGVKFSATLQRVSD